MAPETYLGLIAVIAGYLLGSIPFGLLLTRLSGQGDVRKVGSGNIGATNVLRTGSKMTAALTLLLDGAKGAAAVFLAQHLAPEMAPLSGVAAFTGHVWPVWLKFRGGKGVATYFGVLLALSWPAGLIGMAVWVAVAAAFRYASLASLAAALASPFLVLAFGAPLETAWAFVMSAAIFVRHRDNIRRLVRGEESRIGESSRK